MDPAIDVTSDLENPVYQVILIGIEFTRDNDMVWQQLQSTCLVTSTYEWIRSYDTKKDSRGAFMAPHKYV